MIQERKDQLYLTEADPHAYQRSLGGRRLRAYIMMQGLFGGQLLVGDSQMNNNPELRYWIWPGKSQFHYRGRRDLGVLLGDGHLVPTVRDQYGSCKEPLKELRNEHRGRKVRDLPSDGYLDYVHEKLGGQMVSYSGKEVAQLFAKRVTHAFSSPHKVVGGGRISAGLRTRFLDFLEKNPNFNSRLITDWLDIQQQSGVINQRQWIFIHKRVLRHYTSNIPIVLGTNIDYRVSDAGMDPPVDLQFGGADDYAKWTGTRRPLEWQTVPAVFLSEKFLAELPAEALAYVKGSTLRGIEPHPAYVRVRKALDRMKRGKKVNDRGFERFEEDMVSYLAEVHNVALHSLDRGSLSNYRSEYRRAKPAILRIVCGLGVTIIELIPHHIGHVVTVAHGIQGGVTDYARIRKDNYLRGRAYLEGLASARLSSPVPEKGGEHFIRRRGFKFVG